MRLPRGHRFRPKFDFTVMAPNHGGDSLGSILGQWDPIGSKKWVTTVKNYHALKFDYAPRSSISTKIRLYGYGAKSRCRPPRVHFVANGVQKLVNTVKNYHTPKFEFSPTPQSSISAQIRLYGYGANSRRGLPRVHLGSKNWFTTVKNYHTPKFDFSTTPRSSISTKIRLNGYGAKSRCRPPRVHFVASGVPLGPKNGSKP